MFWAVGLIRMSIQTGPNDLELVHYFTVTEEVTVVKFNLVLTLVIEFELCILNRIKITLY